MTAIVLPFPAPTSLETLRSLRHEAHQRACKAGQVGNYAARTVALKDLRRWDDELRAAEVRAMRIEAQRRATTRGVGAVLAVAKEKA